MRLHRSLGLILASLLLSVSFAFGQGTYKVESMGAPTTPDLPKALADALEPSGARLLSDQGPTVCEVWLRKAIPTKPSASGSSDMIYAGLATGTMVGVLRFPNGGSDFRGQSIKGGYYTLRYALIPQDGNHLGASTYRDFLLLGPADADTQVDQAMTFDATVALSKKASGTNHPAVLSLAPATDTKSFPTAVRDDQGHWALMVKAKTAAGRQDLSLGIIVIGKSDAA